MPLGLFPPVKRVGLSAEQLPCYHRRAEKVKLMLKLAASRHTQSFRFYNEDTGGSQTEVRGPAGVHEVVEI